jgi:hypothetical protein
MCAFFANLLNVPTEPEPVPFRDPVFLVGIMRSGTTLLMNTLSEHPQLLKVGFELNPVWTSIGGAPINHGCLERTEEHLTQEYTNNMTAYFSTYLERSKSLLRKLSRVSQRRFYGSGGVNYDWDNVYLLNKNPHLSNKVRYLNAMYPGSRYVVIVRSPMAQCASLKMMMVKNHKKDGRYQYLPPAAGSCWQSIPPDKISTYPQERLIPGNTKLLAEAWVNLNYTMFTHLEKVSEDRKVVIAYEELMEDRAGSLERIFDMLSLKKKHQHKVTTMIEKERKIHNTSTKGNPLEKWKKHLTGEEMEEMQAYFKNQQDKLDYIMQRIPNADKLWQGY